MELRAVLLFALCSQAASWQAAALRSGAGVQVQRAVAPAMVAVPLKDFDGGAVGEKPVELKIAKSGAYIVHRKVVAEQANMRLGTANSKTRSEVRGGGRKPYKQKGTGRARQGSIRTPLRRGGGVLFGPKPRSFKIKMNTKEKRLALSTALMGATSKMTLVSSTRNTAPGQLHPLQCMARALDRSVTPTDAVPWQVEDFEGKFTEARTKTMKVSQPRIPLILSPRPRQPALRARRSSSTAWTWTRRTVSPPS